MLPRAYARGASTAPTLYASAVFLLARRSRSCLPNGALVGLVVGIVAMAAVPSASGRHSDVGLPPQPNIITLAPLSQTNWVGEQVTHTATITDLEPPEHRFGVTVTFTVLMGPSVGRTFTATTDSTGSASFTYTVPAEGQTFTSLPNAGADQIQASFFDGSNTIGSNWVGQGWSKGAVGLAVPGRPPALIMTPGSTGFVAANPTQALPPGTSVDVSGQRAMSILNYANRRMTFTDVPDGVPSRFTLVNGLRTAGKPILIRLTGGNFKPCTAKGRKVQVYSAASTKKPVKPVRRLWGFGKGRYTTTGKYASATVRGTFWLVADYCNGTLIKVRSGSLVVRNLVTKKTIVVTNGHALFIKAP
jgi:hypothetical protein